MYRGPILHRDRLLESIIMVAALANREGLLNPVFPLTAEQWREFGGIELLQTPYGPVRLLPPEQAETWRDRPPLF